MEMLESFVGEEGFVYVFFGAVGDVFGDIVGEVSYDGFAVVAGGFSEPVNDFGGSDGEPFGEVEAGVDGGAATDAAGSFEALQEGVGGGVGGDVSAEDDAGFEDGAGVVVGGAPNEITDGLDDALVVFFRGGEGADVFEDVEGGPLGGAAVGVLVVFEDADEGVGKESGRGVFLDLDESLVGDVAVGAVEKGDEVVGREVVEVAVVAGFSAKATGDGVHAVEPGGDAFGEFLEDLVDGFAAGFVPVALDASEDAEGGPGEGAFEVFASEFDGVFFLEAGGVDVVVVADGVGGPVEGDAVVGFVRGGPSASSLDTRLDLLFHAEDKVLAGEGDGGLHDRRAYYGVYAGWRSSFLEGNTKVGVGGCGLGRGRRTKKPPDRTDPGVSLFLKRRLAVGFFRAGVG